MWGVLEIPRDPGPHPAVIILHGSSGWRTLYPEMGRIFADSGFVSVALDYYAETGGAAVGSEEKLEKWEDWRRTVQRTTAYLASRPEVDGNRIGLIGFSRGAFLAVSVATSLPEVKAVVDFFGGGGGGTRALKEETAGFPPLLILHGERDSVVPVSFARQLRRAVLEGGGSVEMVIYPGQEHAFNFPGIASYSPDEAADALQKAMTFLRTHLGG